MTPTIALRHLRQGSRTDFHSLIKGGLVDVPPSSSGSSSSEGEGKSNMKGITKGKGRGKGKGGNKEEDVDGEWERYLNGINERNIKSWERIWGLSMTGEGQGGLL